ncbi:uncharacterized protein [Euphorbia lathyris]|uniref:uncharacterized protein n=1 Tax=Euphorbia lathyris TaxID=212925 RepID=UPI003313CD84
MLYIKYNKHGDPIGKGFGWLQSYIGVLARTRIVISYKDWRQVPNDDKEKLWDCVTKKNKYNHRLSHRGYRGIRVEMTSDMSTYEVEKISRHIYWVKARQHKHGKYKDSKVEEVVQRILKLEKEEAEGVFKEKGIQ